MARGAAEAVTRVHVGLVQHRRALQRAFQDGVTFQARVPCGGFQQPARRSQHRQSPPHRQYPNAENVDR